MDGKIDYLHLFGFLVFSVLYFVIQNVTFLTVWFANLAKINVGIITLIWSINPFYMAVADWIIYKSQLRYFHVIGMVLIVACSVLLSLRSFLTPAETKDVTDKKPADYVWGASQLLKVGEVLPAWMPVLFSILCPLLFTTNGILLKRMTYPKYGLNFNGTTLSMTSILLVNILILISALVIWQLEGNFQKDLFFLGMIASIVNTIGLGSLYTAVGCGPMGPVSSIGACSNIMLVVVEAIRRNRVPTWVEFLALVLGFGGALELVIPDIVAKIFKCSCCKKTKKKGTWNGNRRR